jgi:hypothetical protein
MTKLIKSLLDLSEADGYVETYESLLEKKLEKHHLLDPTNIYRSIKDTHNLRNLVETEGTDHPEYNTIMALNHNEVFDDNFHKTSLFDYAGSLHSNNQISDDAMIIVYNGRHFTRDFKEGTHTYLFDDSIKKFETLRAIFAIKWENIDKENGAWLKT